FIRFFFFQAEDGIRDFHVTGVQTCALPILSRNHRRMVYFQTSTGRCFRLRRKKAGTFQDQEYGSSCEEGRCIETSETCELAWRTVDLIGTDERVDPSRIVFSQYKSEDAGTRSTDSDFQPAATGVHRSRRRAIPHRNIQNPRRIPRYFLSV